MEDRSQRSEDGGLREDQKDTPVNYALVKQIRSVKLGKLNCHYGAPVKQKKRINGLKISWGRQ